MHKTEDTHHSLKRQSRVFLLLDPSVVVKIEGFFWTLRHEIHDDDQAKRQEDEGQQDDLHPD